MREPWKDKKWLESQYVELDKSTGQIAKEFRNYALKKAGGNPLV